MNENEVRLKTTTDKKTKNKKKGIKELTQINLM